MHYSDDVGLPALAYHCSFSDTITMRVHILGR